MIEIEQALERFIGEIKRTEVYKEYSRQKEKVSRFPELKAKIDEFRIRNFQLQSAAVGDELFDKIEDFEREYEKFREDPLVSDFLAAELGLCRMMQQINMTMTEELDFA